MSKLDKYEMWDFIVDSGFATVETLEVVTAINGYSADTLNEVLKAKTGLDYNQLSVEWYEVKITGLGDSYFNRLIFEVEGLEELQDAIVETFGDDYMTVYDCSTPGEIAGFLDNDIAYEELTVGAYTLFLNDEPVDPEPLYF